MSGASLRVVVWIAVVAAAGAAGAGVGGLSRIEVAEELARRHEWLHGDLQRLEQAARDLEYVAQVKADPDLVMVAEDVVLERRGRLDIHVFLERYRNDTLEVLEVLENTLEKRAYVDPLERRFGKALHELVAVDWNDVSLDQMVGEISDVYEIRLNMDAVFDTRKTMTLRGEMSLLSILLQIENTLGAELRVESGGELWFRRKDEPAGG